jgi:hypothetical protein
MTDFKDRERAAQEPHVRTLERQMLDTLLRIEELLTAIADNTRPSGTSTIAAAKTKGKRLLG